MLSQELDLRSKIQPDLQVGEKILWVGKPKPMQVALQYARSSIETAIGLILVIIIFYYVFFDSPSYMSWPLFRSRGYYIGSFVLITVASVLWILRPFWEYVAASDTVYAITNRRVLIKKPGVMKYSVKWYSAREIGHFKRRDFADGSGNLLFARETYTDHNRLFFRTRHRSIGMWGIPNVHQVERLITQTFKQG
jgi:hypothetical protein